jgi:uncharacterized YigZ family protein
MADYFIPLGDGESSLTEKRSRFLGHLRSVESEDAAKAVIRDLKKQYHDARHNCWCYRIQNGPERFSDDGEPQGSAGMPMLEVFRREKVQNFVCVVTRYFGGVLLGTGGLSRAYSAAAKSALLSAGIAPVESRAELHFSCPYGMADRIKNLLLSAGAVLGDPVYDAEITMTAMISEDRAELLAAQILDLSGGKICPVITSATVRTV